MSIFGKGKNGFDKYFHAVVMGGGREAQQDASPAIEAQHLLLAIATLEGTEPQRMLAAAGLDHQALRAALDREFEQGLRLAGVSIRAADIPRPRPNPDKSPDLGASSKRALERMATVTAKDDLHPAHLLLGILQAEAGTVPRALALAGIDRAELLAQVRDALDRSK